MPDDSASAAGAAGSRPGKQARRPRDPQARKREIIEATERLIAARGVEGLTHRLVAEEAGLPVASTTYHFESRDDMLRLAFERSVDRFEAYLTELDAQQPVTSPAALVERLADAVVEACTAGRDTARVEYELFLAALRRPALRPVADRDIALGRRELERHLSPARAYAAAAAVSGMILHGLAASRPPDRDEVCAALSAICDPAG
jgi:DNA-binding transcriptional regulator YbjK